MARRLGRMAGGACLAAAAAFWFPSSASAQQVTGVANSGAAGASTGDNSCVGNASTNNLGGLQQTQGGLIGLGLVVGGNNNASTGTCEIVTGDAAAVGNASGTSVGQGSGYGGAQVAGVSNQGVGAANTGGNSCTGNASTNNVGGPQITQGGLIGLGLVVGGSNNISDGSCKIITGDAAAVGNESGTSVGQASGGGSHPWGAQVANVSNAGQATADTGGNSCTGNASTNNLSSPQTTQGGLIGLGLVLGGSNNISTGTCEIVTGDAAAVGNASGTSVGQFGGGGHGIYGIQNAGVENAGVATANTGGNSCVGNDSVNTLGGPQQTQGGLIGLGLTLGGPNNISQGSCVITTGDASAVGNESGTEVFQVQPGGYAPGGTYVVPGYPQVVTIENEGVGVAGTGNNEVVGNMSTNTLGGPQLSQGGVLGAGATIGGPSNFSDGVGSINTGNASAVGNSSTNQAFQAFGN